jgi:hypothetical protein
MKFAIIVASVVMARTHHRKSEKLTVQPMGKNVITANAKTILRLFAAVKQGHLHLHGKQKPKPKEQYSTASAPQPAQPTKIANAPSPWITTYIIT